VPLHLNFCQNEEKEKRKWQNLVVATKNLRFLQTNEKRKRAGELTGNKELFFKIPKRKRAAELTIIA
jgi:hypothetical protein